MPNIPAFLAIVASLIQIATAGIYVFNLNKYGEYATYAKRPALWIIACGAVTLLIVGLVPVLVGKPTVEQTAWMVTVIQLAAIVLSFKAYRDKHFRAAIDDQYKWIATFGSMAAALCILMALV